MMSGQEKNEKNKMSNKPMKVAASGMLMRIAHGPSAMRTKHV